MKSTLIEKDHEEALAELNVANKALGCRLKCASNNRRFLKDVNQRLTARVDELDGQLHQFGSAMARVAAENKENLHLLNTSRSEAEHLKHALEEREALHKTTKVKDRGQHSAMDTLHKQLQLRVEEIASLERQVRENKEKYGVLQRMIDSKVLLLHPYLLAVF